MIVTEVEAKEKTCPVIPSGVHCIASECMWWEWVDPAMYLTPADKTWIPDCYLAQDLEAPKGWCGKGRGRE